MTMMAEAHEREGERELAAERLALAVEVSGNGVRNRCAMPSSCCATTACSPRWPC